MAQPDHHGDSHLETSLKMMNQIVQQKVLHVMCGREGSSTHLVGADGTAHLVGGVGTAHLVGGVGTAHLVGGVGTAHLVGGVGTAHLVGGVGTAHLVGGVGTAHLVGGVGTTHLVGGVGTAHLVGGSLAWPELFLSSILYADVMEGRNRSGNTRLGGRGWHGPPICTTAGCRQHTSVAGRKAPSHSPRKRYCSPCCTHTHNMDPFLTNLGEGGM